MWMTSLCDGTWNERSECVVDVHVASAGEYNGRAQPRPVDNKFIIASATAGRTSCD